MDYDNENIFGKIIRKELPSEVVYEDQEVMVIMDIMPRTNGHCLVIPKTACRNILDASTEQLNHCIKMVQKMAKIALQAFDADGITIQQFNEAAAGQEVFHLHFHILPRKNGVELKRHDGTVEKPERLKENAEKMRSLLIY
jgi:histidine triad (HIT) family protein